MAERPYTNREIMSIVKNHEDSDIAQFKQFADNLNEFKNDLTNPTSGYLPRIEKKMDSLGDRVDDLELARAQQYGFIRATAIFGGAAWVIAMSLIGWMLTQIISLDSKIQGAVNTALSSYEIRVPK